MGRLDGKVTIITGSTLGLGKAAALLFAREGANVVTCDRGRTPENAEKLLEAAEGLSGEVVYQRCDVMNPDDIVSLCDFTKEKYGRVDVIVNNAIIDNPAGMIQEVQLKDWEETIFCHMTAPLLFCKEVIPQMVKQDGGNIINVKRAFPSSCRLRPPPRLLIKQDKVSKTVRTAREIPLPQA